MKRTYGVTFDIVDAGGWMGGRYKGVNGYGLLWVEAPDADFQNPVGKTFTLSASLSRATFADGIPLPSTDIAKLQCAPMSFVYGDSMAPQQYSGSNWKASVTIVPSANLDEINVTVTGTGTGLAKMAVRNVVVNAKATAQR